MPIEALRWLLGQELADQAAVQGVIAQRLGNAGGQAMGVGALGWLLSEALANDDLGAGVVSTTDRGVSPER